MKLSNIKQTVISKEILSKPIWHKSEKIETFDVFESFDVKNQVLKQLNVSIEPRLNIAGKYRIIVKNMFEKVLGDEVFTLQKESKSIYGNRLTVEEEYRAAPKRPKYNIGELLRLISIMTMKKNNADSIKIYSAKNAVYFHSKYKFEPNVQENYELKEALENIIEEKSPAYKNLVTQAKNLYSQIPQSSWKLSPDEKNELGKKTNQLLKEYIAQVLNEGQNGKGHEFKKGIEMILSEEKIQQEANFFNKLYEKHGIDYRL